MIVDEIVTILVIRYNLFYCKHCRSQ